MSSSGYTAWSVSAGEIPTTAYWNILGANDASFNTGNGFNDGLLLPRHYGAGSVTKPALEKPHYGAFYFSNVTGWVLTNSEVTIPWTDSDTTNNVGISVTTGSNANMVIARDGIYEITTTYTCIDVQTNNFITWLFTVDSGVTASFRTTDATIFVGTGIMFRWTLPLTAGTELFFQAYSGSGGTRLGTDSSGTYTTMQKIMRHGAVVAEVR